MKTRVTFVFTHDSIGLGEDGPTHQPVEQLASLRAIPNLVVIRPCDANETVAAWKVAIEMANRPVVLVLSRQSLPTLDRLKFALADGLRRGAYILSDAPDHKPDLILISTGSEVSLVVAAEELLAREGIHARVVSMPSSRLFDEQPESYRDEILPPQIRTRLAVEAASPQGWYKYVGIDGDVVGIDRFGASAPGQIVMREYGFTAENVFEHAKKVLNGKAVPVRL